MALPTKPDNLTVEEQLFCLEYLKGFQAGKAYNAATGRDVKPATANSIGCRWLKLPHIRAHLQSLTDRKLADADAEVSKMIDEVARIAFFNPADIMTLDELTGQPKIDLKAAMANPLLMQCLKVEFSINVTKDGDKIPVYKVTVHDKMDALDKLFKLKKLYTGEQEETKRVINIYANFPAPGSQRKQAVEDLTDVYDHDPTQN